MIALLPLRLAALFVLMHASARLLAAEAAGTSYYYDEVGMRHLTLQPVGTTQTEVRVRSAAEPGTAGVWVGQGSRKDNQLVFAALVEEGQDRGTYFIAKGGESKLEILFRPGQKMPVDAGLLGTYRHISEEKRLQLVRKEFQAAEERLALAIKNASRTWLAEDRAMASDWKSRWPALRERWMKIAYQPPTPAKPAPGVLLPAGKGRPALEMDADYWMKLGQVTAMGYYFMGQMPDGKSQEAWAGDYDDGFGGQVSIRQTKDGRLRVSLTCSRVSELQGADMQGNIPAEGVKVKKGAEPASAEAVFIEPELPEASKEARVRLKRKGGFLWVETERQQAPPGRLSWFDGVYRWMPPPTE